MTKKKTKGATKRGPLSKEEMFKIKQLHNQGKTLDEIMQLTGRAGDSIIKFLNAQKEKEGDARATDREALRAALMNKYYWPDIEKQFSSSEVIYFRETWCEYMKQFGDDVTFSEEMQVKDIITVDILIDRSMKERQATNVYIDELQKKLDKEYASSVPDNVTISNLEEQIQTARSSLSEYTVEYAKLLDKKKDLGRDLKMTRDQRKQKIEDSTTTFSAYIKALQDEDLRLKTGEEINLMKVAKDRAKQKLSEVHVYGDGVADLPLLTPETFLAYKQQEAEDDDDV
jgi:hypothetical protein